MNERKKVKLDLIKILGVCSVEETAKWIKRKTTDWVKMFSKLMSDKEVIPKMNKDLLKLNNKSSGYPIKKWTNDLEIPHQKRCTDDKKS